MIQWATNRHCLFTHKGYGKLYLLLCVKNDKFIITSYQVLKSSSFAFGLYWSQPLGIFTDTMIFFFFFAFFFLNYSMYYLSKIAFLNICLIIFFIVLYILLLCLILHNYTGIETYTDYMQTINSQNTWLFSTLPTNLHSSVLLTCMLLWQRHFYHFHSPWRWVNLPER